MRKALNKNNKQGGAAMHSIMLRLGALLLPWGAISMAAEPEPSPYDLSDKPNNQGSLDYLQETGQIAETLGEVKSAYDLKEHKGAVNQGDEDVLLRYEITETHRYFDSITGEEVEKDARLEGRTYADIVIRDLVPVYYDFSLRTTNYSYRNGTENTLRYDVDYVIGEDTFTYSYNTEDLIKDGLRGEGLPPKDPVPEVTGVFYNLKSPTTGGWGSSSGGAIFNSNISKIKADFIGNYSTYHGGAIYLDNGVKVGEIEGVFIGNEAHRKEGENGAEGGAIWNARGSTIGSIKGVFIKNFAETTDENTKKNKGGAIANWEGNIGSIVGHFIGNYVSGTNGQDRDNGSVGGAIYNGGKGKITTIIGDFIGNRAAPTMESESHGGAIYSIDVDSEITNIIADFIANAADARDSKGHAWGGAIANHYGSKMGTIQGDFTDNRAIGTGRVAGGAIYNNKTNATIDTIKGNFIRNYAYTDGKIGQNNQGAFASGGAIANWQEAHITTIDSNFYDNYTETKQETTEARGGAISNNEGSTIENIKGDFIRNHAISENGTTQGGAIYCSGNSTIKYISGTFYGNYARSATELAYAGAIRNTEGSIKEICNSVFIGNYAHAQSSDKKAHGGAIYNEGELTISADNDTSLFKGNYILQGDNEDDRYYEAIYGGVAYPPGRTVKSEITLESTNNGHIIFEDIINGAEDHSLKLTGDISSFITFDNHVINAVVTTENITLQLGVASEALRNHEKDPTTYLPENDWRLHSNVMRGSSLEVKSGIVSLSDGQYAEYIFDKPLIAHGLTSVTDGQGTKYGTNESIDTTKPESQSSYAAFAFDVNLDDLLNRKTNGLKESADARGDIITVFGKWDKENDRWNDASKGRITLAALTLYSINSAELFTEDNTIEITVQLINFVALDKWGGILQNQEEPFKDINWDNHPDFLRITDHFNKAAVPTALMLSSTILASEIELATTKTKDDSVRIVGWRDNLASWAEHEKTADPKDAAKEVAGDKSGKKIFTLVSADTHHVLTRDINVPDGETEGASAVMWGDDLTIKGEDNKLELNLQHKNLLSQIGEKGTYDTQKVRLQNFTLKNVGKEGVGKNQIYNYAQLTLDTLTMYDSEVKVHNEGKELCVTGKTALNYTVTTDDGYGSMTIDDSSAVVKQSETTITGTVQNQNITHKGETLNEATVLSQNSQNQLTKEMLADSNFSSVTHLVTTEDGKATAQFKQFTDNSLTMEGGKFNLYDMGTEVLRVRDLHMKGGLVYVGSSTVDLAKEKMGGINGTDNADYTGGVIWLDDITIISDGAGKVTHVQFVNTEAGDAVQDNGIRNTTKWGPIYEYLVTYNDEDPHKLDTHNKTGRNGYYTFVRTGNVNPAAQAGAVNEQAGLVTAILINRYSFEHAELYSDALYQARINRMREGKYIAVTPMKGKSGPVSPTCDRLGAQGATGSNRGLWSHAFSSFERTPLNNGPKVDMSLYGALVGSDSDLKEHSNGWMSVFSGYLGYAGSHQKWATSNRSRQNGGIIGATETVYKGNLYAALTVSGGIYSGETTTAYGHERFHMYSAGVAARSGYNIALDPCAKYVLQPSLQVSYTYVGMNDYTNGAHVRMSADAMHSFQVNPFVKLIMHAERDWKPYITGGFVWNMGNGTQFCADGERLPELHIKPYAEYSMGVQKTWKDTYTFYGQATGRSGGRQGFELSTGIRWNW